MDSFTVFCMDQLARIRLHCRSLKSVNVPSLRLICDVSKIAKLFRRMFSVVNTIQAFVKFGDFTELYSLLAPDLIPSSFASLLTLMGQCSAVFVDIRPAGALLKTWENSGSVYTNKARIKDAELFRGSHPLFPRSC